MNNVIVGSLDVYGLIIVIMFLILIYLVILNIKNKVMLNRLNKRYNAFMKGSSGNDLDAVIKTCFSNIDYLKNNRIELKNEIDEIKLDVSTCVKKVGLVRFNAFSDVGSDLSFAIALLDDHSNGIVISSIFSRETSTTYGKPIVGGISKYTLSGEEIDAINIAKKKI
jgi:hypothetical protein